jgi:hypothetical protein
MVFLVYTPRPPCCMLRGRSGAQPTAQRPPQRPLTTYDGADTGYKVILVARNETKALQTSIQLHDADIATKIYLADVSRPREVFIYTHRTPPRRPPHTPRVPLVSLARSEASCGLRTRS